MTNREAAPIERSFITSSCARLGDINGDERSWKMTPALVWRQWTVSINAETEGYLLIPLDLAFTGHQALREAESDLHNRQRCSQVGKEENLNIFQVSLARFRINLKTNKTVFFFCVGGPASSHLWGSNLLYAFEIYFGGLHLFCKTCWKWFLLFPKQMTCLGIWRELKKSLEKIKQAAVCRGKKILF